MVTEIVAAIEDLDEPGLAWAVAQDVADHTGLAVRKLHVDVAPMAEATDQVDAVVEAIVDELPPDALPVVATDSATRWSGKYSVAEGLVDHRAGLTLMVGPNQRAPSGGGPIVVALDASSDSRASVSPALDLAAAYSVGLQLTRVISRSEASDTDARAAAADDLASLVGMLAVDQIGQPDHPPVTARLLVGNDHVAALVAEALARSSRFIAVASHGDRTVVRSTISRTGSGLAAEAPCPVLVVSPSSGPNEVR